MPLIFRIEDSIVFTNFQSLSKRCLLVPSTDNQLSLALIDKVYTFKYTNGYFKLNSNLNSSSVPPKNTYGHNQLRSKENDPSYYYDLQKLMCSSCILENPRFIWTCWTPKFRFSDQKEVCLLCTITINNSINLWMPRDDTTGSEMYTIENVLNLSDSILSDQNLDNFKVFGEDSSEKDSKTRVLFSLSNMGFTTCQFVEPFKTSDQGFLCLINLSDYILFVWVSSFNFSGKTPIEKEEVRGRRSLRGKKINIEDVYDFYEDEEEEVPKKKRKGSDKLFGLTGFKALNKDFYDLDNFDITKCKDLVPSQSKVIKSQNPLYCKLFGAVKVDSCISLYAVSRNDFNFDVYYIDFLGIKMFNLSFDLDSKGGFLKAVNLKVDKLTEVYSSKTHVESMNYFRLFGSKDLEVLTAFSQNYFILHELTTGVTKKVMCGNVPIISYSLEPLYMVYNNITRVNIVNSDGCVYRLLVNSNLNIDVEDVVEKSDDFVPFFTISLDNDIFVYDCLLKGSIFELKFNLRNKSIFINLLLLLNRNTNLDMFLDFLSLDRSNIVSNLNLFTLNETPNYFHSLKEPTDLLEMVESNQPFYGCLLYNFSSDNKSLKVIFCFTLYLFAFVEASDLLPFDKNNTLVYNQELDPFLKKMLSTIKVNKSTLVKLTKFLSNLYKNSFLVKLIDYLSS